ncbi:MAG: hypothetical protein AAFO77_02005 [Pseudomonadota bacterium]
MPNGSKQNPDREDRLRAQLRANLARRKQQARARRDGQGDTRDEGIPAMRDQIASAAKSDER